MTTTVPASASPAATIPTRTAPGATASLVCGIISLAICLIPFAPLVLGIIAIVLAAKAKGRAEREPTVYLDGGMRVGGFVCGIIGTALSAIYTGWWLIFCVLLAQSVAAMNAAAHAAQSGQ